MSKLPKLTELEDMGGEAWQSLMTQLLQTYADHHRFDYRPGPTPGPDHGVDGFAPEGAGPTLPGGEVVFQAKWMWGELHQGGKKAKIQESLDRAAVAHPQMRHWVLVSPHDLTDAEQKWFFKLQPKTALPNLAVQHWGHEQITRLMAQLCPVLFARYYPLFAQADLARDTARERLAPYLCHLIELCRFVPLRGVRQEDRHQRGDPQRVGEDPDQRLELERIFVDLDTTTALSAPELPGGSAPAARPAAPPLGAQREAKPRPWPALEAVAAGSSRHVVLHGAPGCGKSTFVRFLVLALAQCASGRAEAWLPRLPGWPAAEATLLPLRLELRHFAGWLREQELTSAQPCHLWNYLTQELERLQDQKCWLDLIPAVEEAARAGRAIFLLDGLDEVPGGKGKLLVRDCLEQFAGGEIGQRCRIVVTCRTRSYDADYKGRTLHLFAPRPTAGRHRKPEGRPSPADPRGVVAQGERSTAYELAPFDEAKIKRFILAWYEALVELGEVPAGAAAQRVRALQEAVCDPKNAKLGELARNPLLLTVIAHLHGSQRDLKLPDNRAELFYDLIDLLLTRWAERHQRGSASPALAAAGETLGDLLLDPGVSGFEQEHLLQLIAELAHDHYRGGREQSLVLIPAETLRWKLKEQHHDPDLDLGAAWAERVLNFIQFRAGLLNSPDGGEHYDFPHSLLGEYLAAYHLARQRHPSKVVAAKVTLDGNWDEVVRLVAGHQVFVRKETRDALDLAEELCGSVHGLANPAVSELQWRRVALAGDILAEMGSQRLERERHQGPACRDLVRTLLCRLLQQGALPVRDRARAGLVLGRLGDDRPGVGVKHGLPDLDWIEIPPGPFKMGEGKEQFDCALLTRPYRISRYPVTVAQYQVFVDAGGYGEKRFWTKAGWRWKQTQQIAGPEDLNPVFQAANHPRVGVSWYEAVAFCAWLTQKLGSLPEGHPARLPSGLAVSLPNEPEWERAARHTDGRKFPWGDEEQDLPQRGNFWESGLRHTTAVGLFPTGLAPCGAADLAGNVWEWTRSLWGAEGNLDFRYPYRPQDGRENLDTATNVVRVLRGGSWYDLAGGARCAYRLGSDPDNRYRSCGFRLVASPFFPLNSGTSEL